MACFPVQSEGPLRAYGYHQVWVLPEPPGLPQSPVREWEGASPGRDLPLLFLLSLLHGAKELSPNLWLIRTLSGPQINRWLQGRPLSLFQLQAKYEFEDLEE